MLTTPCSIPLAAFVAVPWLLWAGAGLASIPIIIHILNRRRFKIVFWAAMEYLLQAMRKNRRRLRFEQWILLAVRCLIILLLGLALAQPRGCDATNAISMGDQAGALHVLVIDNSYSMAYKSKLDDTTHLERAKKQASEIVTKLKGRRDAFMVITASTPAGLNAATGAATQPATTASDPHAVTPGPIVDNEGARHAIETISQSYMGTDLAGALSLATKTAKTSSVRGKKYLYILTDGTRGSVEGGAASGAASMLAKDAQEVAKLFEKPNVFLLGDSDQWNQAVVAVRSSGNLVTTHFNSDFTADVKGFGNGPAPVLNWTFDKAVAGESKAVPLGLNTPAQVLSNVRITDGGAHIVGLSLAGSDRLDIDNQRWRVVDVAAEMRVLIVEGPKGNAIHSPAFFLSGALAPPTGADGAGSGRRTNSYIAKEAPVSLASLKYRLESAPYRAVILADVGPMIEDQHAELLQRYVKQGGTLIIFVGPNVQKENYNQQLFKRGLLPGELNSNILGGGKVYHFDFSPTGNIHPFLHEFKGQENSGLNTAAIDGYWKIAIPAETKVERVLNYAETGDPAITSHTLEKGRVVFFSTTADPTWNALAPKPAYVMLMHEILAGSVGRDDSWMNLTVGDVMSVPAALNLQTAPKLIDPDNEELPLAILARQEISSHQSLRPLVKPGLYRLVTEQRTFPIAVNLPAQEEADIRVLDRESYRQALGGIEISFADAKTIASIEIDSPNDFAWALLVIVLLLVGVECFLAMRFGHYRKQIVGAAAASGTLPPAQSPLASSQAEMAIPDPALSNPTVTP